MRKKLTIVSRQSALAKWQAFYVQNLLQQAYPNLQININFVVTEGDKKQDIPLTNLGGKGLFIKELQKKILDKEADIAVHSMKDLPVQLPEGTCIGAVLKRADPRDVLVSSSPLADLSAGSIIGTTSLRRRAQILALRPDLQVKNIRGNVDTRISKYKSGEYDAIILAAAGMQRLGLEQQITEYFSTDMMLPAITQGVLAIENRVADKELTELLKVLDDYQSRVVADAERSMNLHLGGSCSAPIAGFAEIIGDKILLKGLVANLNGTEILSYQESSAIHDAKELGKVVADRLSEQGALQLIKQMESLCYSNG